MATTETKENATPTRPPARFVRRTFLIERRFQLKYTLLVIIVGVAVSLLFGAIMFQVHHEVSKLPTATSVRDERDVMVLGFVVLTGLLLVGSLAVFGVLVTHRVAGPLFVMRRYFGLLGEGLYPMLRPLREDDELQDFYAAFHAAIEKMRDRDRREAETIEEAMDALEHALGNDPNEDVRAAVECVRDLANRRRASSGSRVPPTASVARLESAARLPGADER